MVDREASCDLSKSGDGEEHGQGQPKRRVADLEGVLQNGEQSWQGEVVEMARGMSETYEADHLCVLARKSCFTFAHGLQPSSAGLVHSERWLEISARVR